MLALLFLETLLLGYQLALFLFYPPLFRLATLLSFLPLCFSTLLLLALPPDAFLFFGLTPLALDFLYPLLFGFNPLTVLGLGLLSATI